MYRTHERKGSLRSQRQNAQQCHFECRSPPKKWPTFLRHWHTSSNRTVHGAHDRSFLRLFLFGTLKTQRHAARSAVRHRRSVSQSQRPLAVRQDSVGHLWRRKKGLKKEGKSKEDMSKSKRRKKRGNKDRTSLNNKYEGTKYERSKNEKQYMKGLKKKKKNRKA